MANGDATGAGAGGDGGGVAGHWSACLMLALALHGFTMLPSAWQEASDGHHRQCEPGTHELCVVQSWQVLNVSQLGDANALAIVAARSSKERGAMEAPVGSSVRGRVGRRHFRLHRQSLGGCVVLGLRP